ncbi:MAG: ATP-binding cassette domain-containing protein [Coriobacteriales bacterium]|jgi:ABC-2 type transport system ATP-binding protein|nr:ATP-binding cassette domain-containing protein [Coriobacteriales bacterium]
MLLSTTSGQAHARPTGASQAAIEVIDLVKRYKSNKEPSVKGISFEVQPGEFFAFLGPNGAGKTTTISILTTTLTKTSGTVRIAGYDLDSQAQQVRENVGIIFQHPSLDLKLTAEENIRFHACLYGMYVYRPSFKLMPREYRERVEELAGIVGLFDALFKPVGKLSGGMQRKLEIIRSLIHTPAVLFLDEPTSGLDAVARRNLWDYINQVRCDFKTTVFLTTHYIDEAEGASTVCLIDKGKIAMCCPPEHMKRQMGAATLEDAYVEYLQREEAHEQFGVNQATECTDVATPAGSLTEADRHQIALLAVKQLESETLALLEGGF